MRIPVALVPAGLAGALAACASAPPPVAAATPPPALPIHEDAGLDGLYRPPPGGVHGNSACRAISFHDPIRVVDGVAILQTIPAGRLEGRLAPDGSLVIENGSSALRGQFAGDWFNGTYSRPSCTFVLAYKK